MESHVVVGVYANMFVLDIVVFIVFWIEGEWKFVLKEMQVVVDVYTSKFVLDGVADCFLMSK